MKAIIGLGNPGGRYQMTRHNVGFMLIDYLAEKFGLSLVQSRHDYYMVEGVFETIPFILMKPTTFVNNSGEAALQLMQQYNLRQQDMLVIYDDLNLPFSTVRIRNGGTHGGHNGIYSLIYNLNTNQFPRLRIGIGSSFEKGKMAQFVLGKLSYQEYEQILETFEKSSLLIQSFITGGVKKMLDDNSTLIETHVLKNNFSLPPKIRPAEEQEEVPEPAEVPAAEAVPVVSEPAAEVKEEKVSLLKKVFRKKKTETEEKPAETPVKDAPQEAAAAEEPPKKKRGRPKKNPDS